MPLVEFTVAVNGARTAIAVEEIVEVRDLSVYPSRHLERYGRSRITVRAKRRVHHDVRESYDEVMDRVRQATAAPACTCSGAAIAKGVQDCQPATIATPARPDA